MLHLLPNEKILHWDMLQWPTTACPNTEQANNSYGFPIIFKTTIYTEIFLFKITFNPAYNES